MAPKKPAKKDFDMELMFQKIVPSLQQQEKAHVMETVSVEAPQQREEGVREVNLIKRILLEKLDHTMKMLRACDCDRCRSDILALALNELPTFYAVDETKFSDKIVELRRQYEVKAMSALIMAVQKVKAEPRHDG